MKIILYANVSINGKVLLSEFENHQLPTAIYELNVKDINKAGNLIMGRKSFDALGGFEELKRNMPHVEMVAISRTMERKEGLHITDKPKEAIHFLKEKGFEEILVAGGTEIYNLFLKENLITDIVLYVLPIITEGGDWFASDTMNLNFKLTASEVIGFNVIRLQYRK